MSERQTMTLVLVAKPQPETRTEPTPGRLGVSVIIRADGVVRVRQGSKVEDWNDVAVERAVEAAKACCASRKVKFIIAAMEACPCLACEVSKVVLRSGTRTVPRDESAHWKVRER